MLEEYSSWWEVEVQELELPEGGLEPPRAQRQGVLQLLLPASPPLRLNLKEANHLFICM